MDKDKDLGISWGEFSTYINPDEIQAIEIIRYAFKPNRLKNRHGMARIWFRDKNEPIDIAIDMIFYQELVYKLREKALA
jgi:hypothetical protein